MPEVKLRRRRGDWSDMGLGIADRYWAKGRGKKKDDWGDEDAAPTDAGLKYMDSDGDGEGSVMVVELKPSGPGNWSRKSGTNRIDAC